MKNKLVFCVYLCLLLQAPVFLSAQTEPFVQTILNEKSSSPYRLGHPFEILYAPDNKLYITEKVGRILQVDTGTGNRKVLLDHRPLTYLNVSRDGSGRATSIAQDGMMGMALKPGFTGTTGDSIFVAYTYAAGNVRISKFLFTGGASPSLSNETILIQGVPASNDHSSGRLIVGGDNTLYYSCGDMGNNQFGNRCDAIRSQDPPTAGEISASNYYHYSGKILRLNFDGSIPASNPTFSGVRSHVFTMGHRNPQGLVWEKSPSDGTVFPALAPGGKLFSSEQGPRTDDEINIIESGKNYGWPYIAGDSDNVNYQYINWNSAGSPACTISYTENAIPSGATVMNESDAPSAVKLNFRKPILNMFTTCGAQSASVCNAGGTNWMKYATIAPSSIDFYNINSGLGIPGWYPSLFVPTLRKGTLYRIKLNASRDGVTGDTIPYFTTFNRYRDMAMSPDGLKIFIVTDSIGTTSGPSGTGSTTLTNRGAILVYQYTGSVLPLGEDTRIRPEQRNNVKIFPNPAKDVVNIQLDKGLHKPIRYAMYDASGKLALSGANAKSSFNLYVGQLKRGIYIIKLYDGFGLEVRIEKIILM